MADAGRGGGTKWEGLAQFMEDHRLHGITLRELGISDQPTFTAHKHKYKGLTLLMHPCIEGDLDGAARCTGFLVRTELLEQRLFLNFESVGTIGFYGPGVISTLKVRTANKYCTWISMYVRQRGKVYDKGYALRKYEPLKYIKNTTVMGDLEDNSLYAQPVTTWSKKGLGGSNTAIRNKMQKYGKHLADLWKSPNMEDISARGKHAWAAPRTNPNDTSNKLNCVVVSTNVARDLKAKVTLNKPVTRSCSIPQL